MALGVPRRPVRVLHIVESLDNKAVESWLLRVLGSARHDYPEVKWTFFSAIPGPGKLDQVATEFGAEVLHSRCEIGDKIRFLHSLREVMKRGSYDVLHCHHDVMSAAYLAAAIGLPFRKRIVHVHNTSLSLPTPNRVKAEMMRAPMKKMCLRMADTIVASSQDALTSLVGAAQNPVRDRIVHYAVDTARFSSDAVGGSSLREELGISEETKLVLFLGRMVEYKNPTFAFSVLEELRQRNQDVTLVFAGSGDQTEVLRDMAREKRMTEHVHLLGFRNDVPNLMQAADILLWPSLEDPKEGLGLGIVEAQAAGLPILMSQSVPEEAIVVPELVDVLPLAAGASAWAKRVVEILKREPISRHAASEIVAQSSFSMHSGVSNLMALYEEVA